MSETPNTPDRQPCPSESCAAGRAALLTRYPWVTFLVPLGVFMLVGGLEPTPEKAGGGAIGLAIPYAHYPTVYTLKIALCVAAIVFVWPGYRRFPLRVSPLAVAVGVVGVVVWVGLCRLGIERRLLGLLGLDGFADLGARSGFDPLERLRANPAWAWGFLAIRFVGLGAVVPLVEEFFLRGWLMRFVSDARWWEAPMGRATPWAVVLATVVPMLMHPAELLAAAVWFSMVTAMYLKTRNVWDCVAAHAVTNLLLGIYVVLSGQWQLM